MRPEFAARGRGPGSTPGFESQVRVPGASPGFDTQLLGGAALQRCIKRPNDLRL